MRTKSNDYEEYKHVLHLYGLYMEKEQEYLKEAFELQYEVDDMMQPKGINFDEKLGSNRNPKTTPAINQKLHELAYADKKAEEYRLKYEYLDDRYKIEDRLNKLPRNQKIIIEMVYFKKKSYEAIVEEENRMISRQAVSERVKNAVNSFINVHIGE